MKNEKTLQDRVQFFIGIISFIGTVFLFIFLLGKDVQSSDSKFDNSIEKIELIAESFVKINNEILSIKIDNLLNKENLKENENDLIDYKNNLQKIEKAVHEIDKNQESMHVLFNRFVNEEWKEFKVDIKEYMIREK